MLKGMSVKIVADSMNPTGQRITTMLLKYQRFIHSELMTHRTMSRNAASSRAIPITKIIESVENDPAQFVHYGAMQKGMQANSEMSSEDISEFKKDWLALRLTSIEFAKKWSKKAHKQLVNRALEPWVHMTTLVTATDWGNFFNLRVHPDAQPEFQQLAREMLVQYVKSTPKNIQVGDWHLPYGDQDIPESTSKEIVLKIVTARAARTSYLNFDGVVDIQKDCDMHDSLLENGHASPFEHAARAQEKPHFSGNFYGWDQYRKTLPNENRCSFNYEYLLSNVAVRKTE